MELADKLLSAVVTGAFAVFGYLLHHFIHSLRKEINELKEENDRQGTVLFQLEIDLNESWFHIRRLTGKGGGRRKARLTQAWRKENYVSRHWSSCARKTPESPGTEEEDF